MSIWKMGMTGWIFGDNQKEGSPFGPLQEPSESLLECFVRGEALSKLQKGKVLPNLTFRKQVASPYAFVIG